MSAGLSTAGAATMLNALGDPYIQMHFGDPGDDGTSNIVSGSVRAHADLAPAANASRILTAPVDWPAPWSGPPQIVTHLSAWSAATGGTFLFSVALGTHISFSTGMIPRVIGMSVVIPSVVVA